jgi:hypothetical protein
VVEDSVLLGYGAASLDQDLCSTMFLLNIANQPLSHSTSYPRIVVSKKSLTQFMAKKEELFDRLSDSAA